MGESHRRDQMAGTVPSAIERADSALCIAGVDRQPFLQHLMALIREDSGSRRAVKDTLESGVGRTLQDVLHRVFEIFGDFGVTGRAAIGRAQFGLDS